MGERCLYLGGVLTYTPMEFALRGGAMSNFNTWNYENSECME